MTRRAGTLAGAILLASALVLGGCGRKGDLRPPEGEDDSYGSLGTYPAPESVVPQAEGEPPAGSGDEAEPGEEGTGSP